MEERQGREMVEGLIYEDGMAVNELDTAYRDYAIHAHNIEGGVPVQFDFVDQQGLAEHIYKKCMCGVKGELLAIVESRSDSGQARYWVEELRSKYLSTCFDFQRDRQIRKWYVDGKGDLRSAYKEHGEQCRCLYRAYKQDILDTDRVLLADGVRDGSLGIDKLNKLTNKIGGAVLKSLGITGVHMTKGAVDKGCDESVGECKIRDNGRSVQVRNIERFSGEEMCYASISLNEADEEKKWGISEWFTEEKYRNIGIGRITLKKLSQYIVDKYGRPNIVEYTWNGTNDYVLDWLMKHFDAKCNCPIAVQKTQSSDDWDSHIYTLNAEKFLAYVLE